MGASRRSTIAAAVAVSAILGGAVSVPSAFAGGNDRPGHGRGIVGTQPDESRGNSGKVKCVDPNAGKAAKPGKGDTATVPNQGKPAEHLGCDKGKPAKPAPTTPAPEPTTPAPTVTVPATPEPTTPAPTTPAPAPTTPAPVVTTPAPVVTAPAQQDETTRPGSTVQAPADETTRPGSTVQAPADETTRPGSTVVMPGRPAPRMVTRTFQVDRYMPRTAAQARVVARLDDDRKLGYREDKALWGASRWEFVTVTVPAGASKAQIIKAVNTKTSARVGDVRTTSRLATMRAGKSVVMAWELGKGAKPGQAWGASHTVAQTFLARS